MIYFIHSCTLCFKELQMHTFIQFFEFFNFKTYSTEFEIHMALNHEKI